MTVVAIGEYEGADGQESADTRITPYEKSAGHPRMERMTEMSAALSRVIPEE